MPLPASNQNEIGAALARLVERADQPKILQIDDARQQQVREAVERAGAQLLGETEIAFTIALAGCTGAGKSTLINALGGGEIAESSDRRPTTMQTKVYHHRDIPAGGLPPQLAAQAKFVSHQRPELRHKVIVDTPDLDTFATQNREATRALLKAASLVIYVFSPERYLEERAWSVIREEQRFSHSLAVINKADLVSPQELAKIAEEIRQRFAEIGHPQIQVLSICAGRHVPGTKPSTPPGPGVLDEFTTLRAYIEHELQTSDLARILREQRIKVVDHLSDEIEGLIPPEFAKHLDSLAASIDSRAKPLAQAIGEPLTDRLTAVESELEPLATMRAHQRFWGPFRIWLSVTDFLRFGLPTLVRQARWLLPGDGVSTVERLLVTSQEQMVDDRIRQAARQVQDYCFQHGLPIGRWREIAAQPSGERFLRDLAARIEARYESQAAGLLAGSGWLTFGVSFVGALVPGLLVVYALGLLVNNLVQTTFSLGLDIVGFIMAISLLFFLVLQGAVDLLLACLQAWSHGGAARAALDDEVRLVLDRWVSLYREQLEEEVQSLREPVAALRDAVARRALHFASASTWEASFVAAPEMEMPAAPALSIFPPAVSDTPVAPTAEKQAEADPAPLDAAARLRRAMDRHK